MKQESIKLREAEMRIKILEQAAEVMRRAVAYLSRDVNPKCALQMHPLVRELAADGIHVTVTCWVMQFSKQVFYKWQSDPVPALDWDEAHVIKRRPRRPRR